MFRSIFNTIFLTLHRITIIEFAEEYRVTSALAVTAFVSLILTIVFIILLVTAPKEKRRQMKKLKIALCVSAIVMVILILLIPRVLYFELSN